jgi:5'-3' exonuclease
MGIGGLLMNTKSIGKSRDISAFRGQRAGVDGYSWLHKALHGCATEVAINKNLYKIVRYFEKNIRTMISLNIRVVIVFDGDQLPLKKLTDSTRHENRQKNYDLAINHYYSGRFEEANKLFAQAIDITPSMAFFVKLKLEELFPQKLEFIVAPYEADSQLAYLSKINYIDFVITEDSDLLVFGAKKMFYKMDKNFKGCEVELANLSECEEYSFKSWTHDKFIQFCILAGCDYLSSPKGIAFKKAYTFFAKYGNVNKVLNALADRLEDNYYDKFLCAYIAFKYQRVFCPNKKQIVCLNTFKVEELSLYNSFDYHAAQRSIQFFGSLDFIGKDLDTRVANDLAACRIDPITKKIFVPMDQIEFMVNKNNRQSFKSLIKQSASKKPLPEPSQTDEESKSVPLNDMRFFSGKKIAIKLPRIQSSFLQEFKYSAKRPKPVPIAMEKRLDTRMLIEQSSPKPRYDPIQSLSTSESQTDRISSLMNRFKMENERIRLNLEFTLSDFRKRLV